MDMSSHRDGPPQVSDLDTRSTAKHDSDATPAAAPPHDAMDMIRFRGAIVSRRGAFMLSFGDHVAAKAAITFQKRFRQRKAARARAGSLVADAVCDGGAESQNALLKTKSDSHGRRKDEIQHIIMSDPAGALS